MNHIVLAVMAAFVPVLLFLVTWVHSQGASIHMPFYRVDPDGWHFRADGDESAEACKGTHG